MPKHQLLRTLVAMTAAIIAKQMWPVHAMSVICIVLVSSTLLLSKHICAIRLYRLQFQYDLRNGMERQNGTNNIEPFRAL